MIVTAHTPNLLPGISVMRKIAVADVVIWCDRMQYERHGWCNRQELADGTRITVPVRAGSERQAFGDVLIADDHRWRTKIAKTLDHHLGQAARGYSFVIETSRYHRLVALNAELLAVLCHDLDIRALWVWQSHLEGGTTQLDEPALQDGRRPYASERIARMVDEVGGDFFLSGPSGRLYLDETPFRERDIEVDYHDHDGPNPSSVCLLSGTRQDPPGRDMTHPALAPLSLTHHEISGQAA